jgi:hypothetical protein
MPSRSHGKQDEGEPHPSGHYRVAIEGVVGWVERP